MKKFIATLAILSLLTGCASMGLEKTAAPPPSPPFSSDRATLDTTNFDTNLSSADDTVQKALDTLDEAAGVGTDDQTATEVPFTPAGTIASENVQAAIEEVASEAGGASGNVQIALDGNPDATNDFNGLLIRDINAGETITQWDMVYFDTTDTEWKQADADQAGEWPAWGIATAAGTNGNELVILIKGVVEETDWNWTVGAKIYLSATAGGLTETAPSSSGACVQPVGIAISADAVLFDVDPVTGYGEAP